MTDSHYLTSEGLERLKQELEFLKGPSREEIAKRLRSAIQMGDLSENADYISAKEDQGFMEGRIQELEQILRNVVIIEETSQNRDVVTIGARITVQEGSFEPETYHLVGPKEADPRKARISHESPIGKALIGHKIGDEIIAETPVGTIHLVIINIE